MVSSTMLQPCLAHIDHITTTPSGLLILPIPFLYTHIQKLSAICIVEILIPICVPAPLGKMVNFSTSSSWGPFTGNNTNPLIIFHLPIRALIRKKSIYSQFWVNKLFLSFMKAHFYLFLLSLYFILMFSEFSFSFCFIYFPVFFFKQEIYFCNSLLSLDFSFF